MDIKNECYFPISVQNITDKDIVINLLPSKSKIYDGLPKYNGISINTVTDNTDYKKITIQKNIKPLNVKRILITSENIFSLISKLKISHIQDFEEDINKFLVEPIIFIIPPDQIGNLSVIKDICFTLNEKSYLKVTVPANEKFIIYIFI